MNRFLEGKFAAVTGGTRGIGRAIAQALADSGAEVAICGRTDRGVAEALAKFGSARQIIGNAADVSKPEEVARWFEYIDSKFPTGLDILVNNAGVGIFRNVADMSIDEWQRTIGINLNGAFYCSREALPRFAKRGGGFIVNVSSLAGKNPFAGGAAYNASKFGLNGFSEALMLDHRYDNVRVCYVMPGSVETEFGGETPGEDWKIASEDIAGIVLTVVGMPARTMISRVEVRPSKPKRK